MAFKLADILMIFVLANLQSDALKKYRRETQKAPGNFPSAFFFGFLWALISGLVYLFLILQFSEKELEQPVSLSELGELSAISETQAYKDYSRAMEEKLAPEANVSLMKPFYEKYKEHRQWGPEVSQNYGLSLMEAGKFDEGKAVLQQAAEKFPQAQELQNLLSGSDMYQDIGKYNEYMQAVTEYLNKNQPEKALPAIHEFHEKYRQNAFLHGETYYNFGIALIKTGKMSEGKQLISEGAQKYPANTYLQDLLKHFE